MSASKFDLKDIPIEVMTQLKRDSKRLRISVNALILKIIERGLGLSCEKCSYHDLDHLAGTWSSAEEKAFENNTGQFRKIDFS
jgi:hypothetical protein